MTVVREVVARGSFGRCDMLAPCASHSPWRAVLSEAGGARCHADGTNDMALPASIIITRKPILLPAAIIAGSVMMARLQCRWRCQWGRQNSRQKNDSRARAQARAFLSRRMNRGERCFRSGASEEKRVVVVAPPEPDRAL